MEVGDRKDELDLTFRCNVLNNVIMKALMTWCRKNNTNPNVLSHLKDIALCFERVTYNIATNKDDYLKMIQKILICYKLVYVAELTAVLTIDSTTSFFDTETIDAADRKLLMRQAQSAIRRNKVRHLGVRLEQMIKFLQLPESDLTLVSKETLLHYLNKISQFFNSTNKLRKLSVGFQTAQFYVSHSSVTNLQTTQSELHTTLSSRPMVSSPKTGKVLPHSQSNASISTVFCSPDDATRQTTLQTVQNKGPHDTTEQNAHLDLKRSLEPLQSINVDQPLDVLQLGKRQKLSKKKDFMDTMFLPMTKSTSTNANCQTSRGHATSSKPPEMRKCNTDTSSVADPIAMSQPKPLVITFDSPSTPVTLPSVAEKIVKPVREFGARTGEGEGVTMRQDNSVTLGTPGASFSFPSDSSDSENNQHLIPAKLPFEHIIQSVSCSIGADDLNPEVTLKSLIAEAFQSLEDDYLVIGAGLVIEYEKW